MQPTTCNCTPTYGLDLQRRGDRLRRDVYLLRANQAAYTLKGWFFAPEDCEVQGIRVLRGATAFQARRKQLRVDVLQAFPERVGSLHSGFEVDLSLKLGQNVLFLEYKTEQQTWKSFGQCKIFLPPWWTLWRSIPSHDRELKQWLTNHRKHLACVSANANTANAKVSFILNGDIPRNRLATVIRFIRRQTHRNWELAVLDPHATLRHFEKHDPRIRVVTLSEAETLEKLWDSALAACTGEFTFLLSQDAELIPEAIATVLLSMKKRPEVDLWFSDEVHIDKLKQRPFLKPGWSMDILYQNNVFGHFCCIRTELLQKIKGFHFGVEGDPLWDLAFRAIEETGNDKVGHLAAMLCQIRTSRPGHNPRTPGDLAGRQAVDQHLSRKCPGARLVNLDVPDRWRVEWPITEPAPKVSIVIPTKNQLVSLRTTLESLERVTNYACYEVIVVDHDSDQPETLAYLAKLGERPDVFRIIKASGPFNWSRLSNLGADAATGEVLVFLNNDIEIIDGAWLRELVSQVLRPGVAVAGACLLYPDGRIQHAGIVIGMTGVAGHVFRFGKPDDASIGGDPAQTRDVSAVTGACLAILRCTFYAGGQFDETQLPVNYSDVDLCLRLRKQGLRVIYTPHAKLIHHESVSRSSREQTSERKTQATAEALVFSKRWLSEGQRDAFYNPHLSLSQEWPRLEVPSGSERVTGRAAYATRWGVSRRIQV
ncbi:MAG: glycosyltransferase [Verrucomicrobiales bacterium]